MSKKVEKCEYLLKNKAVGAALGVLDIDVEHTGFFIITDDPSVVIPQGATVLWVSSQEYPVGFPTGYHVYPKTLANALMVCGATGRRLSLDKINGKNLSFFKEELV